MNSTRCHRRDSNNKCNKPSVPTILLFHRTYAVPKICIMCPRWHIKGARFSDCKYTESHMAGDEVPSKKQQALGGWRRRSMPAVYHIHGLCVWNWYVTQKHLSRLLHKIGTKYVAMNRFIVSLRSIDQLDDREFSS